MDAKPIIDLLKREVVPAIGCTEPVAVALCVAKAVEILGCIPDKLILSLSGNIIKNAMGVGIPGTDMIGLPIAAALGVFIGKPEYGLEVLRDVSPEALEVARQYVVDGKISIENCKDSPDNLYIDVTAIDGCDENSSNKARCVISGHHTNFVLIQDNGNIILDKRCAKSEAVDIADPELSVKQIYDFSMGVHLDEIAFMKQAAELNMEAAKVGLSGKYGHSLGSILHNGNGLFGNSPLERIMTLTSAACDARMGGAKVAVMSNSGSGNQGITATMPVVSYANDIAASEEMLIRALTLSHLTSIYIKQSLGRLSALCGCVVASTGASVGLVYLMGGGYDEMCKAIKNMVANLTGMICDGAKPACAMKIASGVSTAVMSAMLAIKGKCVSSEEGIVDEDIDRTIENLTSIGREAMIETDRMVLDIMVGK